MIYRDRFDIIRQILEVANKSGGTTRTKIMYRAFVSYGQMKGYLTTLTESGLLNYDVYTQTFKTTETGLRFIEIYNQMDGMIKPAEEELQV